MLCRRLADCMAFLFVFVAHVFSKVDNSVKMYIG